MVGNPALGPRPGQTGISSRLMQNLDPTCADAKAATPRRRRADHFGDLRLHMVHLLDAGWQHIDRTKRSVSKPMQKGVKPRPICSFRIPEAKAR